MAWAATCPQHIPVHSLPQQVQGTNSLSLPHTTTTAAMSGVLSAPTLNIPHLSIETSPSELKVRVGRARSSSIVKIETVGEDSQEEGLDQGVYDNLNAEWVNRKGESAPFMRVRRLGSTSL